MIDEKRLIEELRNVFERRYVVECTEGELRRWIENQPKVGEWIPIGQYPTEPSLLCFEDGSMAVGYYEDCGDCIILDGLYGYTTLMEAVAWQPLPQPYKGE